MTLPDSPRRISLVLDTTAILAFTRQSFDVGEALAQVSENGTTVALPLPCLVMAAQAAVDQDRLRYLTTHEATVLFQEDAGDWPHMSALCGLVEGEYDATSAAWIAIESKSMVMSARPELYAAIDQGQLALPFDK